MGVTSTCFNHEIIKMHSTVTFPTFYTTHFFRQFVALKKSRRQFIFLFTPGGEERELPRVLPRLVAFCRQAAWGAVSERRRFGSMRASLRLLSRSRAPGPQRLALLAGAGAVAAAAVIGAARREEGTMVHGAAPLVQPPGSWMGHSRSWESGSPFQELSL